MIPAKKLAKERRHDFGNHKESYLSGLSWNIMIISTTSSTDKTKRSLRRHRMDSSFVPLDAAILPYCTWETYLLCCCSTTSQQQVCNLDIFDNLSSVKGALIKSSAFPRTEAPIDVTFHGSPERGGRVVGEIDQDNTYDDLLTAFAQVPSKNFRSFATTVRLYP